LIPEIYAVRDTEKDIRSVSSKDLVEKINNIKPGKALFFKDFEQTANYLRKNTKKGDLIITIGAGPVNQVGEMVLKQ
jgi:UDP-N-acetylmuramate--alanine ligase